MKGERGDDGENPASCHRAATTSPSAARTAGSPSECRKNLSVSLRFDPALDLARDGHADQIGARLSLAGYGVDIRHHARRDRKHQPQIVKLRPAAGLALPALLALRVAFFFRFTRSLEVISYIRNCPKPLIFL